jgi:hypothetical protein
MVLGNPYISKAMPIWKQFCTAFNNIMQATPTTHLLQ